MPSRSPVHFLPRGAGRGFGPIPDLSLFMADMGKSVYPTPLCNTARSNGSTRRLEVTIDARFFPASAAGELSCNTPNVCYKLDSDAVTSRVALGASGGVAWSATDCHGLRGYLLGGDGSLFANVLQRRAQP